MLQNHHVLWGLDVKNIELSISSALTIGVFYKFKKHDQTGFISKFVCLYTPAFIRSIIFVFIPLFVIFTLLALLYGKQFAMLDEQYHLGGFIGLLSLLYSYYYIAKTIVK